MKYWAREIVDTEKKMVDSQTIGVKETEKEREEGVAELRTLSMEAFGFALLLRFGLL